MIISEEFDFPTKYASRKRQAQLQTTLGKSQYALQRREVLLNAQFLYFDIVRINQVINMLTRRLQGASIVQHMYETRMKAGDANILELNKVKLDRIEVQGLVAQSFNQRSDLNFDIILKTSSASVNYAMETQMYKNYSITAIMHNTIFLYLRGICTTKGIKELDAAIEQ